MSKFSDAIKVSEHLANFFYQTSAELAEVYPGYSVR